MDKKLNILAVFLLLTLSGCIGSSRSSIDGWIKDVSSKISGNVEPLPKVKPYTFFIYQASDLPDPFSLGRINSGRKKGAGAPDESRAHEPLEDFDISKLVMVGALKRGSSTYGLVEEPGGRVYRVQVGNYIGRDNGKVVKVSENEIELSETIEDQNGEWVQRATTMYLEEQQTQN